MYPLSVSKCPIFIRSLNLVLSSQSVTSLFRLDCYSELNNQTPWYVLPAWTKTLYFDYCLVPWLLWNGGWINIAFQYFIVLLKDRPFELWDLKSLNIIREMPGNFPPVTTLEWSPTQNHPLKNAKVYSLVSSDSEHRMYLKFDVIFQCYLSNLENKTDWQTIQIPHLSLSKVQQEGRGHARGCWSGDKSEWGPHQRALCFHRHRRRGLSSHGGRYCIVEPLLNVIWLQIMNEWKKQSIIFDIS
jgi:WD40 repeat protein